MILETAHPQDLLDYSNSLKYADYLYKTHQYNLSSVEYERVVFLEPTDTLAKLKLVRSYRYMKNYTTALERIDNFFPHSLDYLPEAFSDEYIRIMLYENQYQEASVFLQNNMTLNGVAKTEYQLGILVMQHQWSEAKHFADESIDLLAKTEKFESLYSLTANGLSTQYKSPALAVSLSAIIPGAGKVYTKNWKDAIYSFLFVTTFSWLAYNSYADNGLSFNSVLFGSIALSFYSANIYGSYRSAIKFNEKINQLYKKEAEDILLNDQGSFRY
ncbi:MAG: hypothetical protein KAR19_14290 [Bacteroidales bacterium]|nr:hypothetical protein [Bacteroidales bacterium]